MANHGLIVKLTSEGGAEYITATHKVNNKYSEGPGEVLTFEQSILENSIAENGAQKAVNKALEHAKIKKSDVVVLY